MKAARGIAGATLLSVLVAGCSVSPKTLVTLPVTVPAALIYSTGALVAAEDFAVGDFGQLFDGSGQIRPTWDPFVTGGHWVGPHGQSMTIEPGIIKYNSTSCLLTARVLQPRIDDQPKNKFYKITDVVLAPLEPEGCLRYSDHLIDTVLYEQYRRSDGTSYTHITIMYFGGITAYHEADK
jgi:hypothetical protein